MEKMEKANKKVIETESNLTDLRAELERKNIRIGELENRN